MLGKAKLLQVGLVLALAIYAPQAAAQPAAAPAAAITVNSSGLPPCGPTVIQIPESQLVNQTERTCGTVGGPPGSYLVYGRGAPFGFTWNDTLPGNCSIESVSIVVLPGISCTGVAAGGGAAHVNGQLLPQFYSFPFDKNGRNSCSCTYPMPPPQVLSVPVSSYVRGGNNTLSIFSQSGTNGLAVLDEANLTRTSGIYGEVVINQWIQPALLPTPRASFGYTATQRNTVLAVGGVAANGSVLATVDEFNSTSRTWNATANTLAVAVADSQVAPLTLSTDAPDSSGSYWLLNAGGLDADNKTRALAALYDTQRRLWTPVQAMNDSRARFQLTAMYSGTNAALATGGIQGTGDETNPDLTVLRTAELYDQDQSAWLPRANMSDARSQHRATRLATANLTSVPVLVTGGLGLNGRAVDSAEILDALDDDGVWQDAGELIQARYSHTATALPNGSVLVAGGSYILTNGSEAVLRSCELWTNGTGFTQTSNLTTERTGHQAVMLSDGTTLVAGGRNAQGLVATAELWNPLTDTWVPIGGLPNAPLQFGLAALPNATALAFGGGSNLTKQQAGTTGAALFTQAFSLSSGPLAPSSAPAAAPGSAAGNSSAFPGFSSGDVTPNIQIDVSNDSGIGTGGIIGIVVGVVVLLLAVIGALLTYFLLRRRRQQHAHAQAPDPKLPGAAVGAGMGYPRAANGHAGGRGLDSAPPAGFASKLAAMFQGRRAAAPATAPPAGDPRGLSVEMRKAQASPFAEISSGETAKVASVPAAVVLPSAMASPFDDLPAIRNEASSPLDTPPSRLISPATSGASWNQAPHTGASAASRASGPQSGDDRFDSGSGAPGWASHTSSRRVMQTRESNRSDISRVSATIQHGLSSSEWKIERSALTLGKRLGKGGFGEVFEGRHHGSAVAIKVLEIADDRSMTEACQEFGFLHGLRHSKLVISYGACVDGNNLLLVMERMEEDLFHAIASDQTMSGDSVLWYFRGWKIALDVASALVFLHSKGMVHLDVKSLNILLKGRRSEAKLGDLGLARMVPEGALFLQNTLPGTPAYSAPEVMQAQLQWRLRTQGRKDQFKTEVGTPADIFSFGVVLFEICTGCHPARWRQEFTGELRPEQCPPAIAKLIDDCLNDDPQLRPTAAQVLQTLLENRPPNAQE